ncbi:MAG: dihydrolipoamide acetyltransferase family protein [Actinomycetes bacterium]
MSAVFTLPDLGEGLTEAEIIAWRVGVGDTVQTDQVVVEVETAKAAVEVPCPHAGTVTALHAEPGTVLPVGQPLITVEPVGAEPSAHATHREEERAGSGNVLIGYGTGHGAARGRRRRVARPRPARDAATPARDPATAVVETPSGNGSHAVRVISPIVRRLAAERGVDLTALTPSGPGGVVRRADVEAVAADHAPRTAGETRIPLRGVRRVVADTVSRSRREIPDVTIWVDVDATGLLDARRALSAAYPDHKVSVLALVARICLAGLRRFPELNARVEGDEIVQSSAVHLGFAAQTDRGLVVPVVRDAHALTTIELADALRTTTEAARAGTLTPDRLTGGTFTLNNYGVFGVDGSTPIINHPEAAMVGVGRIVGKPWAVDGQLAVRKVAQLSLTFDHRVCDGGVAGGFVRYVADCVEAPAVLLGGV